MLLLWFDGNGYLYRDINSATVKLLYRKACIPYDQTTNPLTRWDGKFLYKWDIIQFDATMIRNDLCLEYINWKQWNAKYLVTFPHRQLQFAIL